MAEPVFDEHPLEEYFRRAGESAQVVPGGAPEFSVETDDSTGEPSRWIEFERLPSILMMAIEFANRIHRPGPSAGNSFAERFKYDVISSSLLSTSISAPVSTTRHSFSPDIPGNLDQDSDHSTSSNANNDQQLLIPSTLTEFHWPIMLIAVAAIILVYEYYFVAIFLVASAAYTWHNVRTTDNRTNVTTATLDTLNDLISVGSFWESTVNEAIAIIEKEERSIFYGPTNPHSPSSGIRVTLQSSLHTTQVQCDNVRQLLSALTEPSQLSQLSEMYAPSSPMRQAFSLLDHPRPLSVPLGRQRTISVLADKRATWNGSYASLALAGSPTAHLRKRRQQRGSDLTVMFNAQLSKTASMSAPATPHDPVSLQDVQEEGHDSSPDSPVTQGEYFGATLLDFQRKRRSTAMETFGIPPPSYSSHSPRSHRSSGSGYSPVLPTISSSSRFTTVHTTRHPLSLSGLQQALHGALSAKRYACSHLLALRFDEDEDDTYWEDVRSVMALLTSTFEDASSRLTEALNEAEQKRVRDERPSPEPKSDRPTVVLAPPSRTMAEMVSFAPMPSHLTRFAAHVDAISSALNEAREHLEECVSSLRGPTSSQSDGFDGAGSHLATQDHPAFEAYDRLRKELGFALRECERGKERLLDIVSGPRASPNAEDFNADADDIPGEDSESDTSDKLGPSSPAVQQSDIAYLSGEHDGFGGALNRGDEPLDDVTAHLLMTASSQHLPPPGVEQVFEADTGATTTFARERSKLSREERIKLAKARRESSTHGSTTSSEPHGRASSDMWGPGGEVVQELKDVIWKVSEKRKRLAERPESRSGPTSQGVYDTPRTADIQSPEDQAS